MATSIVSNSTAATFGNSPQKTGEPVDRLSIYSGKALEFDGVSDYITSNPDFLVNSTATTAMTVAVWVNVDDISSNQDIIAVFDTNENSKFLGNYNGAITFTMYNNDYSTSAILGQKTDDAVLTEGQWHRIVATYDGSQTDAGFKIYMDGALIASSASNDIFSANLTTHLTIGRTNRTSGSTNDFAGKMSDFQVWDTVWSLADVTYDYLNPEKLITSQNPSSNSASNLRVWYPMNDTGVTNPQTVIFDGANSGGLTSNYVSSPSFDSDSGWSLGTNWSISGGKLIGSANTANGNLAGLGLEANFTYKVVYSITSYTSGQVRVAVGGEFGAYRSGVGTYTEYIPSGSTGGNLTFRGKASDSFTGEIDDLTVQKVKQGYHGTTTFFGDNLVTGDNSTFTDGVGDWAISTGGGTIDHTTNDDKLTAIHGSGQTNQHVALAISTEIGKKYTFGADLTFSAGNIFIRVGESASGIDNIGSTNITSLISNDNYAINNHTFVATATTSYVTFHHANESNWTIDNFQFVEVGIATGWTDANQQQYIPQTAFMDGCVKKMGNSSYYSSVTCPLIGESSFSFGMFVHKPIGSGQNYLAGISGGGGTYFQFNGDTSILVYCGMSDTHAVLSKSGLADDGSWKHVIITVEENNANMYINGALVATDTTVVGTLAQGFTGLGRYSSTAMKPGTIIDEITKWNKALSSTEVSELYNNGVPLNATKHSASSNLVGYYKNNNLTSNGKMEDLSTNNNHAGTINTPDYIFFQQGVTADLCTQSYSNNIVHSSKGSMHLNGSTWVGTSEADYADLPYNIDIEGDFSVEMWRKLTRKYISNGDGYVLGADSTDFVIVPYAQSSGKMTQVYIRQSGGDTKNIQLDTTTDGVDQRPSIYEWFHYVLVRESGTYKVYINGLDINTDDREVGDSANDFTFRTIAKMLGTSQYGQGFIDDLRIYDKALSIKEVKKNYNNNKSQHKN